MSNVTKRDSVKQSWEDASNTEFPLVCETCLGDNPYVRMTKEAHGKKCQICETPFTVFAWQAGTKGRIKRVEICKACAKAKNVCQVCIYDLQYGLPVKVRDKILKESGALATSTQGVLAVPQSRANRSWSSAMQQRALTQNGQLLSDPLQNEGALQAHAKLAEMAQMEPRYERNLPKLCSFFAQGECNRGANCPFRHEMPRDRNDPMSNQSTKNRFYGTNDPVANKILGRRDRFEQNQITKQQKEGEADGYDKAPATLYVRLQGEPPWPALEEMDCRDLFYAYGEIVAVRIQPEKGQAFIEYSTPEAAELAMATLTSKSCTIHNRVISVQWARALKRGETGNSQQQQQQQAQQQQSTSSSSSSSKKTLTIPAPPGGAGSHDQKKKIPTNLTVKPPPEVAAIAAARRVAGNNNNNNSLLSTIPSGGGPLRETGVAKVKPHHPYYPSTNPNRLGTKGKGQD